jgi:hypothetical protein
MYDIMLKNILQPDRPEMTKWRKDIACWIPQATNTQPAFVIKMYTERVFFMFERYTELAPLVAFFCTNMAVERKSRKL